MREQSPNPMSSEYQEKNIRESYRNAILSKIKEAMQYETRMRKNPGHIADLDHLIEILNIYNQKLGLPLQTKEELRFEVLQREASQLNKHVPQPSEVDDITDTDIDDAIAFITDEKNAKPIVDPLGETPLPEHS